MSLLDPDYKKKLEAVQAAEKQLSELSLKLDEVSADAALMAGSMLPPPLGTAADIASLAKSVATGSWGDALLDVVGFIPIIGDGAKAAIKGTKVARRMKAIKAAVDKASDVVKQKKEELAALVRKADKSSVTKAAEECGILPCGGATNRASHETHKIQLRRQMSKPSVEDPQLQKITNSLYRPNAKIGSGSTADAIRHERATGNAVGGRLHTQKGEDSIRALDKWLNKNPKASPGDRAAAENIIFDLKNALGH